MKIMILAGVYGHNENGHVRAVRAGDPPIEVEDAIGERLVRHGVAAAVVDEIPDGATIENVDSKEEAEEFPDYDEDMTRAQLEKIALQVGITEEELKTAKKKADVIALLDEAREEYTDEAAPDLDAAEAIQ